jgi:hypothetical protein
MFKIIFMKKKLSNVFLFFLVVWFLTSVINGILTLFKENVYISEYVNLVSLISLIILGFINNFNKMSLKDINKSVLEKKCNKCEKKLD